MSSKYLYPDSNILINKLDIKNQNKLDIAEKNLTSKRLMELEIDPIYGKFDLKHLQRIHKHIFQDIYNFAGELRCVDIGKDNTLFCRAVFIAPASKILFDELKAENNLKNYDFNKFAERSTYYLAEINVLHPFREGNGRTQREFIRTLGLNAGFNIRWDKIDKDKLFNAQVNSKYNLKDLESAIKDCIVNKEKDYTIMKNYKDLDRGLDR
ncbi:MAG: Fic/DOC family protein [Vulcanibacillus sp.]